MAEFYVYNSLNDKKAVRFTMSFRYFVIKGEEGEHMWTIEIGTTHPASDGSRIPSRRLHTINTDNIDQLIEKAVIDICKLIDWEPLVDDVRAPYVASVLPEANSINSLDSVHVSIDIKDALLSAGIDLSNMKVIFNNGMVDFDITSEVGVHGDPYNYTLKWEPALRIAQRYNN